MIESSHNSWPIAGIENLGQCPVCQSAKRKIGYTGLRDYLFGAPGSWDLWHCAECGAGYLDPRPTRDTIAGAYSNYYTHIADSVTPDASWTPNTDSASLGPLSRVRRMLANGYRNSHYGSDLKPASGLGTPLIRLFRSHQQQIDFDLRYLPTLKNCRTGRILDVGFGDDRFLRLASKIGWQVHGSDIDPVALSQAKKSGFDVREGGVEAWEGEDNLFDYISFNHVIEHLHDPEAALEKAQNLLVDGGRLFIEMPNLAAGGHSKFGRHWRGLEPPRHLVLYTTELFIKRLALSGWKDIRVMPRPDVRSRIDEQSSLIKERAAIAEEVDCEESEWANCSSSEFITIIAHKPEG